MYWQNKVQNLCEWDIVYMYALIVRSYQLVSALMNKGKAAREARRSYVVLCVKKSQTEDQGVHNQ